MSNKVEEMYEEDEIITLEFEDENGKIEEVECGMMGVFECEGKEYVALEVLDESGDVLIYGYKEVGDDEFELVDIEDDAEYEKAAAEFDAIMAEEE